MRGFMRLFSLLMLTSLWCASVAQPFFQYNYTPSKFSPTTRSYAGQPMCSTDSQYLFGTDYSTPMAKAVTYKLGAPSVTTLPAPDGYKMFGVAVSDSAKVVVGMATNGDSFVDSDIPHQAFVYENGNLQLLGSFGATQASYDPVAVTADGEKILCNGLVGIQGGGFRGGGFIYARPSGQLTWLANVSETEKCHPMGMSPDGELVFGQTYGTAKATYWLSEEGFSICHILPIPPADIQYPATTAMAVSAHGRLIFGYFSGGAGKSGPIRWDRVTGLYTMLGPVQTSSGFAAAGPASSCSGDGDIVIGSYSPAGAGTRDYIWTPQTGAVDLQMMLEANGAGHPYARNKASGISFDGTTIYGTSDDLTLTDQPYYIYLPTPVAQSDVYEISESVTLQTNIVSGLFANDRNTQDVTAAIVDPPQHGTLTLGSGGAFSYKPNAGFVGSDAFSYKLSNARFGSLPAQVTLLVQPRYLGGLSLLSASSPGGKTVQGKASFAIPAAAGQLLLTSARPAAAAVPTSVPVPQNATSATFSVTTGAVLTDTKVTISATFKGLTKSIVLTVIAPKLVTFTLGPTNIVGGNNPVGKLTLNGQAADPGATVLMSSSNPAVASVISKTVIPTGATFARLFVYTKGVSAPATATITASYHGILLNQVVTVNPASLGVILVKSPMIVGTRLGSFTVALDGFAPSGGAAVTLTSNSSSLPVPVLVTVPAGGKNAYFTARAGKVLSDTSVTVTGTYNGASKSVVVVLHPG